MKTYAQELIESSKNKKQVRKTFDGIFQTLTKFSESYSTIKETNKRTQDTLSKIILSESNPDNTYEN